MVQRIGVGLMMLLVPVLAACSGEEPAPIPGGSVTIPASTVSPPAGDGSAPDASGPATIAPNPPAGGDDATEVGTELPPKPGPDQCATISEAADGRYQVYDAGTVVVLHTGDRLELHSVRPAAGWTDDVDTQDDDEVKVEFRKGQQQLNLEVEIDDGQFSADICNDRDDD